MLYFVPTYFFENNNNEKEYSVIYTSIKRLLYLTAAVQTPFENATDYGLWTFTLMFQFSIYIHLDFLAPQFMILHVRVKLGELYHHSNLTREFAFLKPLLYFCSVKQKLCLLLKMSQAFKGVCFRIKGRNNFATCYANSDEPILSGNLH